MLPKPVTTNVTNAEVGGIVFTSEIIPKNSVPEDAYPEQHSQLAEKYRGYRFCERKSYTKSWFKRGGIGVVNLTVEIIHKLMASRGNVALGNC